MSSIDANKNNLEHFDKWYQNHKEEKVVSDDWLWVFDKLINDADGPVIDLGCGLGNDTMYLLNKGKKVIPCDGSLTAIRNIREKNLKVVDSICFDMLDKFPFPSNIADLIVADLSLHYFTREDTIKILNEIKRVLTRNGHMLCRVNSINDVNYGAGVGFEVEPHLYMTEDGRYKRFFDYKDIYDFFSVFNIKYVREEDMKRYTLNKKAYVIDVKSIG